MFTRIFMFILPAVAWAMLASPAAAAANDDAPAEAVQLFILAGQSNMEGLGLVTDLPEALAKPQADVQIWFDNARGLQPLAGGFGHVPQWFGPEVTLGRTLADAMPDQEIVLVKAAYSGANLAHDWNPKTGKWYGVLKEKIALAKAALEAQGKTVHIAGMFWIQGESDSRTEADARAYAENLAAFIDTVREDYQSPKLPFIFTRVHAKLGLPEAQVHGTHGFDFVPLLRESQQAVAKKAPHTRMVNTDDLPLRQSPPNYDNLVHFDTKGYLTLGKRLAQTYLEQVKGDGAKVDEENTEANRGAAASERERPNIVLCMTDDQGYGDVGYMGHPVLRTPAIDAMAAAGLRFHRFYAAAPVCSPTRASFLTGRHPNRLGCFQHGNALRPSEDTIAWALKRAGYRTGHFGKWHIGSLVPGDDTTPGAMGFDEWASAMNFYDIDPWLSINGTPQQFRGEGSMVTMDRALDFIGRQTDADKPFLAVIWFGNPHDPHQTTDELRALYPDQPGNVQNYYGEISGIDRAMGKLRSRLRKLGIEKDTVLLFTSDNGGRKPHAHNGDLHNAKGTLWEGGIRVPAIVEWPGHIAPGDTHVHGNTSDIYPTVLELAHAAPADAAVPLDGISLVPLFDGSMTARPHPMGFWAYPGKGMAMWSDDILMKIKAAQETGEKPDVPRGLLHAADEAYPEADALPGHAAWIDGDLKLHRTHGKGAVHYELYNLADDPREQHNIIADHPDAEPLKQALDAWQRSVIESLRGADVSYR